MKTAHLPDSTSYIVNKFEHVGVCGWGTCTDRGPRPGPGRMGCAGALCGGIPPSVNRETNTHD